MKHYPPAGRRNYGRPFKRLLDTWDRNGSKSGPTPWQIYDGDDILTVVLLRIQFFWGVTQCCSVSGWRRLEGLLCLHPQRPVKHRRTASMYTALSVTTVLLQGSLYGNPSSGNLFDPCGQKDGRTDTTKLIVAFFFFALLRTSWKNLKCLVYRLADLSIRRQESFSFLAKFTHSKQESAPNTNISSITRRTLYWSTLKSKLPST
jgi:hypothetical protein